jgi:nicotinate-nucleotide pyrophosphorylase (carboxylating)
MMRVVRKSIPGVEVEFTGGIKPENLRPLAKLGPDRISMGRLTHSVPAFDCSLDILHVNTE